MHAPRPTLSRSRTLAVAFLLLALSLAASAPAMAQSAPPPSFSISDPSPQEEGGFGAGVFKFVVTLSGDVPSGPVHVSYRTVALDATPGDCSDFAEAEGTLSFNESNRTEDVFVTFCGDTLDEADERFEVELHSENGASVEDRDGVAEIIDDDPPPSLSIGDVAVDEPDTGGTATATFDVRLSKLSGRDVAFNFAPTNLTASGGAGCGPAGVDFETPTRSGVILAGALTPSEPVRVTVCGDLLDEANETFRLKLQSVVNASNAPQATGTIVDDDPSPSLSINNPSILEAETGTSNATFTVGLSTASGRTVAVDWSTADVTARGSGACGGDADYIAGGGTLLIPAGASSRTITVPVCGDRPDELNETFRVNLSSPSGATGTPQGTATITDNDPPPLLHVGGLSRAEGGTGSTAHAVPVILSDPRDGHLVATGRGVTFDVDTFNGATSAATGAALGCSAGVDYKSHVETEDEIAAGSNKGWIFVDVCGDASAERSEQFSVRASSVLNATLADSTGVFTILNDDGPDLTIGNSSGLEGSTMTFKVKLTGATSEPVRVDYETRDGTAHADAESDRCGPRDVLGGIENDYGRKTGTLVFPASTAAVQYQTITVLACADSSSIEFGERFTVRLSRPDFARITVGDGTGTIS